jgi:RNA polymerase sigma factor (sigma-70 family)
MSAVTAAKVTSQLTDAEFDQLFRDHYQLVYRTAFSVTRSAEDAEDVLQTVFLRLVRRRFPPGLKKNPKAYLYRAAFNRAVDIVRARPRDIPPADAERLAKVAYLRPSAVSTILGAIVMGLERGTHIGRFQVVEQIGAGGNGVVYRAYDTGLGRDVALKVLSPEFGKDTERLRRFEQEARAASSLNHSNIVTVYEIGVHENAPYLVSELLEGHILRDELRAGSMPVRKALNYAAQIANGIAAAHEKGIVHRDLKSENIFVTGDRGLKILDFRLAKLVPERSALSDSPTIGTGPGIIWALSAICFRSRCAENLPILARTSSVSASLSTKCSPARVHSKAKPRSRRCTSF